MPDDPGSTLRAALVAAYRPVVAERVGALDDVPGLSEAVGAGERWLDESLSDLLERPFRHQARSPLELIREAMRFPASALDEAGVPPAHPNGEDAVSRHGLTIASSQELGEAAWAAHLAWGVAKSRAMTKPAVGLLSIDLMDRARVEEEALRVGYAMLSWADLTALEATLEGKGPRTAFVDLTHPDADAAVRRLAAAGIRVTGYGPHVDEFAMSRARLLGAVQALPRSRFFSTITKLLPPIM